MQNDMQPPEFESLAAICQRLKDLRVRVCGGRGQSHFASLLHLSPSTYNYYEKGRIPPVDVLDRASRITNAPLLWLIRGEPIDFKLASVPPLAADAPGASPDAPQAANSAHHPGHTAAHDQARDPAHEPARDLAHDPPREGVVPQGNRNGQAATENVNGSGSGSHESHHA